MNRWIFIALLAFTSAPLLATDVAYPAGSAGAVTLDWKKFDEIWTRMQALEKKIDTLEHPENTPPIPFSLSKAAFRGQVNAKRVVLNGLFEIAVYEPKQWVKVPFLPSSVAIEEVLLDGKPAGVLEEGGYHQLLLKGAGRHVLEARLSYKAPRAEQAPTLSFDVPNAAVTLLSLDFPQKNLDVHVEPSQGVETRSVNGHTFVTASIPATSQVNVRWQNEVPEELTEPSKLYLDSETLMTLSEASAHARWNLSYNVLHRGVREVRLLTPEAWNILSVNAEGLQEWKAFSTSQGSGVVLTFAYARKGAFNVVVDAERALSDKEEIVELPHLKALGIEREQGTIGIEAKGAVELQVQESQGLNPIDPQELPGSVWSSATQPILYAFRHTKPHSLAVAVKRHPEVAVLTTTVDDAHAVTLITPRGQLVTRMQYQVRNHLKQYLEIRLPKGVQLWSAFVAGTPVKPVLAESGAYRIPLAKSQIDGSRQEGFTVELTYYETASAWWPLGIQRASFPVPDAPVSRVYWSLYLSERYRFAYFGGDLEKGVTAQPISALLGGARVVNITADEIRSDDARNRAKKDFERMEGKTYLASKMSAPMAPAAERQMELEESLLGNKPQQLTSGVFPVSFEVPTSGRLFRFGQVMIVGQSPRLSMVYLHAAIVSAVLYGLLLALLGLLYRRRAIWGAGFERLIAQWPSLRRAQPTHE